MYLFFYCRVQLPAFPGVNAVDLFTTLAVVCTFQCGWLQQPKAQPPPGWLVWNKNKAR